MKILDRIKDFLRGVWKEMKLVKWLSKKELVKYTLLVLGITFVMAGFLGILDFIFSQIIRKIIFLSF